MICIYHIIEFILALYEPTYIYKYRIERHEYLFHLSKSPDFPNHYSEHKFGKKIGKEIGSFAKDNMINFKKNFQFPFQFFLSNSL